MRMFGLVYFLAFLLCSCNNQVISKEGYNECIQSGRGVIDTVISNSDSLEIVEKIKFYSSKDWLFFIDYSRMYDITNDEISFIISRIHYSPERQRIIVWYCKEMVNANTLENYSDNPKNNRICPLGDDTIYSFGVLIGYKDSNEWKIYPWGNRQVSCCSNYQNGISELEKYYYSDKMRGDNIVTVLQEGKNIGLIINDDYRYNIIDSCFWEKSPLWIKDTVGSNGLYPFEVSSYYPEPNQTNCTKCAIPFILPR